DRSGEPEWELCRPKRARRGGGRDDPGAGGCAARLNGRDSAQLLPSLLERQGVWQLVHQPGVPMPSASRLCLRCAALNMTEREAFYTVDRIERGIAVLVGDEGVGLDVRKGILPVPVREGVVLRVRLDAQGSPDWSSATIDDAERGRRGVVAFHYALRAGVALRRARRSL